MNVAMVVYLNKAYPSSGCMLALFVFALSDIFPREHSDKIVCKGDVYRE